MISLNDENDLLYIFDNVKIDISTLYENKVFFAEKVKLYPNLSYEVEIPSYILKLKYNGYNFDLFMIGIKFTLIDKEINGVIYSIDHLKSILKKYEYKNPVYCQKSKNNFEPLNEPDKIENFNFFEEINIKENENMNKYNDIYDLFQKEYVKENLDIFSKSIKIKLLSMNYEKYFSNPNIAKNDLDNQISIFKTTKRFKIFSEVTKFLNNKDKIFAICGPFGIGKSFTSLLLQKQLFLSKYNTLYINLINQEEICNLKETLIKETFFLNLNKQKFISLANDILISNVNSIWDIISLIDEYCDKENINFLLILDQYRKDRDKNDNLNKLKVKNIFLLSSINDKDVKKNLFSQYKGKTDLNFKYIYYISFGINDLIKENYFDNKNTKLGNCLKDFNFFPNSINLLENVFHMNILDFYNNQYYITLKKISNFYKKYKIDYLTNLFTNKKINDSKTKNPNSIGKDDFFENINDIPLKYITYNQNINSKYLDLYYAFDYAKYPIENEINNYIGTQRFKTNSEASLIGGEFENIIKHKFILDKPFKIDSFIIVDKIVNMELVNEFKNIEINDLKSKSCVFICQKDFCGEDYDFALLYPIDKKIILIQAKYKISNSNVTKRSQYSDISSVSIITNSISQKLDITIEKIYLLYISSIEYNYSYREKVFKILNSKEIICIFYSVKKDYFTSDFENDLSMLLPTTSMEIYPNANEFVQQNFSKRKRQDELIDSLMKLEQELENDNEFISNQYKQFLIFLKKTNISSELKSHLGNFETLSNNYRLIPKPDFETYFLFFKVKDNKEIDFKNEVLLVYDNNGAMVYYSIKNDRILKNFSIKNDYQYKNYYYAIGKWIKDIDIKLEEN